MEISVIIESLATKTKMVEVKDEQPRQITTIQIETEINPRQLARIHEYQRAGQSLFLEISSPQAELELFDPDKVKETANVT